MKYSESGHDLQNLQVLSCIDPKIFWTSDFGQYLDLFPQAMISMKSLLTFRKELRTMPHLHSEPDLLVFTNGSFCSQCAAPNEYTLFAVDTRLRAI